MKKANKKKYVQQTNVIALDQALNEDEGKDEVALKKEMEEKEMKAQAQILEMVRYFKNIDYIPQQTALII